MKSKSKPSNDHDVVAETPQAFVPENSSYDYGLAGLTVLTALAISILIVFWISLPLAMSSEEVQNMSENKLNITHPDASDKK